MTSSTDIAIVGAGPYGLSIAAHLRERDLSYRIFGTPMKTWLQMPASLNLKSLAFATNIYTTRPSFTFPEWSRANNLEDFEPCPMSQFAAYGVWAQKQLVPNAEAVDVTNVRLENGGFAVTLESGETLRARRVVIATGLAGYARMPEALAGLPPELASHTSQHHEFSRFKGKEVAVIGGGASALEAGSMLHEAGAKPIQLVREAHVIFHDKFDRNRPLKAKIRYPLSVLGPGRASWVLEKAPLFLHMMPEDKRVAFTKRYLGPSGPWWLKDRFLGIVPLHTHTKVIGSEIHGEKVRLRLLNEKGGSTLDVDHVIAGTGYDVDVDSLSFVDSELARRVARIERAPSLSRHFETSVPGLYFAGPASAYSFGPLVRFVAGAEFAAPAVARHLARNAHRPVRVQMPAREYTTP